MLEGGDGAIKLAADVIRPTGDPVTDPQSRFKFNQELALPPRQSNRRSHYLAPVGTPGRGEWTKTADREFALTFYGVVFVSFGDPTVIGTYKVRSKITLDQSGMTFNAPALIDIFDPAGNLSVSIPATAQGRRAAVESLP